MIHRTAGSRGHDHCRRLGLSLLELVVVLASAVVWVSMLAPALHAARQSSRDEVCLNNLRELGEAIHTYAGEYAGRLPGPLHPAVYRVLPDVDYGSTDLIEGRHAVEVLSNVVGDAVNARTVTCPVMSAMVNNAFYREWGEANPYRNVFPVDYALNNYGSLQAGGGTLEAAPRFTNPGEYFGYTPPPGSTSSRARRLLGEIPRTSEEWMVADAWYRPNNIGSSALLSLFKQEGTYQSAWSGEAMPYFAPHGRPALPLPVNQPQRQTLAVQFRAQRADGWTNTAFIDGHVAAVPSRTLSYQGQPIMYGFPGTVNPDTRALSSQELQLISQFRWE